MVMMATYSICPGPNAHGDSICSINIETAALLNEEIIPMVLLWYLTCTVYIICAIVFLSITSFVLVTSPLQPCNRTLRNGFISILRQILKIRPGGLLIGGPPCGSWVWINRSTSKRSANRLFGDARKEYVKMANANLSLDNQQW